MHNLHRADSCTHCVRSPMVLLRGSTTLQTSSFTSTVTLCFSSDFLQNGAQQHQPREWEQLGSGSATSSSRAKHRAHSSLGSCHVSKLYFYPCMVQQYHVQQYVSISTLQSSAQRGGLGISTINKREHDKRVGCIAKGAMSHELMMRWGSSLHAGSR